MTDMQCMGLVPCVLAGVQQQLLGWHPTQGISMLPTCPSSFVCRVLIAVQQAPYETEPPLVTFRRSAGWGRG